MSEKTCFVNTLRVRSLKYSGKNSSSVVATSDTAIQSVCNPADIYVTLLSKKEGKLRNSG